MRNKNLLGRAKQMRREPTGPEEKLWNELRAKRLEGAKFRDQALIDSYIVDFVCRMPTKLVVEVDGDTHADQIEYDRQRDDHLQSKGYRVLRFSNDYVWNNLDGVLLAIQQALRTPPLPDPLP